MTSHSPDSRALTGLHERSTPLPFNRQCRLGRVYWRTSSVTLLGKHSRGARRLLVLMNRNAATVTGCSPQPQCLHHAANQHAVRTASLSLKPSLIRLSPRRVVFDGATAGLRCQTLDNATEDAIDSDTGKTRGRVLNTFRSQQSASGTPRPFRWSLGADVGPLNALNCCQGSHILMSLDSGWANGRLLSVLTPMRGQSTIGSESDRGVDSLSVSRD